MDINYGMFNIDELWCNKRTYAYKNGVGSGAGLLRLKNPGCDNLPLVTTKPPGDIFVDPASDGAPWYDTAYPESADFYGLWVTEVTGFDTLGSRDVTSTPFGSTVGRRRLDPKTITVTGWLVGKNCCATQYGYRWLSNQLMERNCIDGSETSILSLYDCCPTDEQVQGLTEEEVIEKYFRSGYECKVAKHPQIIQKIGSCCNNCDSTDIEIQFTFVVQNPKWYRKVQLALEGEAWPEDIQCLDFGCDPCPAEPTVEVSRTYQKTRFPVSISRDRTYCPVGDYDISEYFDEPTHGYLDIVNIETTNTALQISVSYTGTWTAIGWDPTEVDLCDVNIEIVEAVQGGSVTPPGATITAVGDNRRMLPVDLTTTSSTGGTWVASGWTHSTSASAAFPPLYSELIVLSDCGCDEGGQGCEVVLYEDLTWEPFEFNYVGILPPSGCSGLSVRRATPGTYTVIEEVPVSEAFLGCNVVAAAPPDPFAGLSSCYCQPVEWVELAQQINFSDGIERAQPYLEVFAGSSPLYNFRADFYALPDGTASWVADGVLTEDLSCVEPEFSIRVGRSIPANSRYVYSPQNNRIFLVYDDVEYDYSASTSGINGSSPYFFEFPECFGVVVVISAEVHNGDLPAADSTITLGYAPFVYVGV